MSNPLVSVIVPTKNSSRTLANCLESIKNQTYTNIEIIVVDNFSNDSTKSIALGFTDRFFECGPERSAQRNFGADHCQGKYVIFIDSDMKLSDNVIEECVFAVGNRGLTGIIIPEESFGEGFWAQCKKLERSFYLGVNWMEAARFFSKEVFLQVGGYDEALVSGEDWDISQRVEKFGHIGRIDSFIFHDEGKLKLLSLLKKKYFYAQKFAGYVNNNTNESKISEQTGIVSRYRLFVSNPKKLLKNPVLGLGMLFMKTCEFGVGGVGYMYYKLRKSFHNIFMKLKKKN